MTQNPTSRKNAKRDLERESQSESVSKIDRMEELLRQMSNTKTSESQDELKNELRNSALGLKTEIRQWLSRYRGLSHKAAALSNTLPPSSILEQASSDIGRSITHDLQNQDKSVSELEEIQELYQNYVETVQLMNNLRQNMIELEKSHRVEMRSYAQRAALAKQNIVSALQDEQQAADETYRLLSELAEALEKRHDDEEQTIEEIVNKILTLCD